MLIKVQGAWGKKKKDKQFLKLCKIIKYSRLIKIEEKIFFKVPFKVYREVNAFVINCLVSDYLDKLRKPY